MVLSRRHTRLNIELSDGHGRRMRKTYSCPFYNKGDKGCSISRSMKPYGCLAFNPSREDANGEEGCFSMTSLLENREDIFSLKENKCNLFLKEKLGLWWDKIEIPTALLEIHKKEKKLNQLFAKNRLIS